VPSLKILTNCIMKLDGFHFALIAIVVLLAVYGFGSGGFRGGAILEGGKFYGERQHEEGSRGAPIDRVQY
jgi:hypothetical protein